MLIFPHFPRISQLHTTLVTRPCFTLLFLFFLPCTVATMRMHVLVDMLIGACDPMLSPIRGVRPVRQLRPRHLLWGQPRHHGYIFTPTSHSTFPTFFFIKSFRFSNLSVSAAGTPRSRATPCDSHCAGRYVVLIAVRPSALCRIRGFRPGAS